jgi:preprotein translocase subunit SecG
MQDNEKYGVDMSGWTPELLRQRRRRAAFMAVAIAVLVGLFFLVTVVRITENIATRSGS